MTMTDTTAESITVTYTNGDVETYSNCTLYTNNGTIVSFTGQLSGQETAKKWEINWSQVRKLVRG
jgi:hypothetical protein